MVKIRYKINKQDFTTSKKAIDIARRHKLYWSLERDPKGTMTVVYWDEDYQEYLEKERNIAWQKSMWERL